MKKRLYFALFLILCLFSVSFVNAMSCIYSSYPFLNNPIRWICIINNSDLSEYYLCNSYSYDVTGTLINANPEPTYINGVGSINYFKSFPTNKSTQIVNIKFDTLNMLSNRNVTLNVICKGINNTLYFNKTVNPIYKQLTEPVELLISTKTNINQIIGLIFLIIILSVIFIKIYSFYKNG